MTGRCNKVPVFLPRKPLLLGILSGRLNYRELRVANLPMVFAPFYPNNEVTWRGTL